MMLLVDVGNTQTVIGVTDNSSKLGEYRAKWRISTDKRATSDDILSIIAPLFEISEIPMDGIDSGVISSVVPSLERSWTSFMSAQCGVRMAVCNAALAHEAGLFDCDYPSPHEIGADRIADAIAAKAIFGSPVVVVDFGTATNMEVIDRDGLFIGGAIAPGVSTASEALFSNASKIQPAPFCAPERPIGRSTREAVESGIVLGQAVMVDGLLEKFFGQLGYRAPAIGTGGLVNVVGGLCANITEICPDLTIDGLRLLGEKIKGGGV